MGDSNSEYSIFIATPCYGGNVHVSYMESVMKLTSLCQKMNIKYLFFKIPFESLIPRARNVCTAAFLKTECTHLLFLDSDIEFNPIDVFHMIKSKHDLIGGNYCTKHINGDSLISNAKKSNPNTSLNDLIAKSVGYTAHISQRTEHQTIFECTNIATGFMLISRKVILSIIHHNQHLEYVNDIPAYTPCLNDNKLYNLFETKIIDNRYVSEDYGFCQLWIACGGKIYTDLSIKLVHHGSMAYTGDPILKYSEE